MLIRFMQSFLDGLKLYPRSSRFGEEWPADDFDRLPSSVLVKLSTDNGVEWVKKGRIAGDKDLEAAVKKAKAADEKAAKVDDGKSVKDDDQKKLDL